MISDRHRISLGIFIGAVAIFGCFILRNIFIDHANSEIQKYNTAVRVEDKKPQERNLSGIYTRIKRNGKYQTVDLTDMTPEELAEYLDEWGMDCNFLQRLVQNLVETVQKIAEKFDIEVDEEE